jgi:hypothetical protein
LKIKPANIIIANNLAICKIFMNKVDESINILEELVKKDAKKNLNDLVV